MAEADKVFKYLKDFKNKPLEELKNTSGVSASSDIWKRYQDGDNSVSGQLLKSLDSTITGAINAYAGGNNEYRTKAKVLALEAVKTYDPTHDTQLSTHVHNSLKKLTRISADRGNIIHMPEQSALDRKQLDKVIHDYVIDNGEEPSKQVLSDITGMPINKINRLMKLTGQTSTSAATSEQGDLLDRAPRTAVTLYEDTLYQELDPTNQKIYEWLTGYKGSPMLSRQEVANRLKMTTPALSQRIAKIDQFFASNGKRIEEVVYGRNIG